MDDLWMPNTGLTSSIISLWLIYYPTIPVHLKIVWGGSNVTNVLMILTRSNGRKKAEALEDLLPAFSATALPWQSTTGEPLEPPLVPDAA